MNQVAGLVPVEPIRRDAKFEFMFAGKDSKFQRNEMYLRNMFAGHVFLESLVQAKNPVQAIVFFITFDSSDLQKLVFAKDAETATGANTAP